MEEDQGRTSPPLPSRGAYNIDFDALDDSFNPFATKKAVQNSPPLSRKEPVSNAESLQMDSAAGGGDSPPKEFSETPKKKKQKSQSSKRASAVIESEGNEGAMDTSAAGEGLQDGSSVAAADGADKPVKTRKIVKKPKSRPVSKNIEQKADEQGSPEKTQPLCESTSESASAPAETDTGRDDSAADISASMPRDSNVKEETCTNPPSEKVPEQNQEEMATKPPSEEVPGQNQEQLENFEEQSEETLSTADKDISQSDKSPHQLDKTATYTRKSGKHKEKKSREDKDPQEAEPASETSLPAEKSPLHREKSSSPAVGEEGAEISTRKERSAGKVKKTKSKVKKSPRHSAQEGDVDGMGSEKDKDSKDSRKVSSHGDGAGAVGPDSPVDAAPAKAKHPATRVLEQQMQEAQSQALTRNNQPNDSEDDFYDAFDSPPPVSMDMVDPMQSYSDMNDSCTLFQSHDGLGGLAWSQEEGTLLDEGAGEAAFAEDLTIGDSDMADSHSTESVVKLVQVLKYSQSDWNKLRQELELNFQAQLLAKEKEWSAKLADRDARLATLDDTNKKLRQTNEDMRTVMGEFEKTIGQLQSEKEKTSNASQQSLQDVIKERDQALEDLQSVETAFSDLHRRYEKTKGVLDGFKQNEEVLKKCVQDLQNKLKKTEQKIQVLKEQAEEKLERATEEIEKVKKSSASDIAKLEAALRKADLQVQSMESTLEQKVKENKELAAICDELIAKVQ